MSDPYRTPAAVPCTCEKLRPNPGVPERYTCPVHDTHRCWWCGRLVSNSNWGDPNGCHHTDASGIPEEPWRLRQPPRCRLGEWFDRDRRNAPPDPSPSAWQRVSRWCRMYLSPRLS